MTCNVMAREKKINTYTLHNESKNSIATVTPVGGQIDSFIKSIGA